MANKITETGVLSFGGALRMPMDRVNEFFSQHKGQRVIATFEAVPKGTTTAMIAYYRAYVLPTVQAALWKLGERKSEKAVDEWLRSQYPMRVEGTEMSPDEMADFLDWLKQFAAENLYVYIEDPRTI